MSFSEGNLTDPAFRDAMEELTRRIIERRQRAAPVSSGIQSCIRTSLAIANTYAEWSPAFKRLEEWVPRDALFSFLESSQETKALAYTFLVRTAGAVIDPTSFSPPGFATLLENLAVSALAVSEHLGRVRVAGAGRPGAKRIDDNTGDPSERHLLIVTLASLARLAAISLSTARSIAPTETKEIHRMQRHRDRKRRGVEHQISLEIFRGDLELLRQEGFLLRSEMKNRAAVTRAVQAFLLGGFLTPADESVPWRSRREEQQSRIAGLLSNISLETEE